MEDFSPDMLIAIIEAREKCKDITLLEDRIKAAMKVTKNHWLVTDVPKQFKCACAAALMESPEKADKDLITKSHSGLSAVSHAIVAMQGGADIDIGKIIEDLMPSNVLPLLKWWREIE